MGVGRGRCGRDYAACQKAPRHDSRTARRHCSEAQGARRPRGCRPLAAQDREECPMPGNHHNRRRRRPQRIPHSQVLASGRRAFHHAPARHQPRPREGQSKRRHLPDAGIRQTHHGDALAEPQGRCAPRSRRRRPGRRPPRSRRRPRRRSGHRMVRFDAPAARYRRVRRRGLHPRQAGRIGQMQDQRP